MNGTSPLISAQEVLGLLSLPYVKVFDVRGTWSPPPRAQPEDYASGHIPGATFLDWTAHFLEPYDTVNLADIADAEGAAASFKALDINEDDLVILYDDYHQMQAGRIWWAMRHWGFENVRVLNGGWKNWIGEGLPSTTDNTPLAGNGTFIPRSRRHLRVDTPAFLDARANSCVIDARGPINYAGKDDDPRSGHIPGAINIPFALLLDADTGCFLDDANLRQIFQDTAPGWHNQVIIASCGSGYAGTITMLALEQIGVSSALYDGSISAWKTDESRQLNQGVNP